ncbi:metallophosphoesterase [Neobacillus mesonae]|nr:metallophosphoesterase [Neobacillus mesonae]
MLINSKMHTIFLLAGPTECGKTTFAKEVLIPGLRYEDTSRHYIANIQYLSSDAIREELLGHAYDKYDSLMLEASGQAFELLYQRLHLVTSFPINADFIVVDTTALSPEFRSKVRDIAKENNYRIEVILFDYRIREDYFASERSKKLISTHVTRLKKEVLPVITREGYDAIHRIKAKNFLNSQERPEDKYQIVVEDRADYLDCLLLQDRRYIVVGDVHERVDALQGLLRSYGYRVENNKLISPDQEDRTRIILAGDWIDKGKQTKEIIHFLYENQAHFHFVSGNHENFVYKYMLGEIKGADSTLLNHYFDSTRVLTGDGELLQKFNELVKRAKPFFRYIGRDRSSYYVTHAPCKNKYIGKLDDNSRKHQRNFRLDRGEQGISMESQLAFLQEGAVNNHPYHVFGHVAARKAFRIKNKVHIDTGAVQGNALTSVIIQHKPVYKGYRCQALAMEPSQQTLQSEQLPYLFSEPEQPAVSLRELDENAMKSLEYAANHQINFISGTMSPADKDVARGELESMERGLKYFIDKGIHKVTLQPKYMGSRCNVYLFREPEDCYAVSRNGYRIKGVDLRGIYEQLLKRLGSYMREKGIQMLLLDGELLPWKAMGDGLIERQFKPIARALESETDFLAKNGFEQAFTKLVSTYDESGFEKEQFRESKSALSEKYGPSLYQTYKHVSEAKKTFVPLEEHAKAYETYKRQLDIYAGDAELSYKPFAILKEVRKDGEESVPDMPSSDMFRFLNEDACLVIDLDEENAMKQAADYFQELTNESGMEGVVIKPEFVQANVVPSMKVRNPDYLSIVYGYDYRFPHKYSKLMKQKNIKLKLRTSLEEYKLGSRMLAVKYADISLDNTEFRTACAGLLWEVEQEKEMDPRL